MKRLLFLVLLTLTFSCKNDGDRVQLPGTPTSIKGNVRDDHRNIAIDKFQIKLTKHWGCSAGFSSKICEQEIKTVYTDANGNYTLNFEYNLREDESYWLYFNEVKENPFISELKDSPGEFAHYFDTSDLIKGEENILNINAWKPIKVKVNLTVLNNHTPPLRAGIKYNGKLDLGSKATYKESKTFVLLARPNSEIDIEFWYIKNDYHYGPSYPYKIGESDIELNLQIDCNKF